MIQMPRVAFEGPRDLQIAGTSILQLTTTRGWERALALINDRIFRRIDRIVFFENFDQTGIIIQTEDHHL